MKSNVTIAILMLLQAFSMNTYAKSPSKIRSFSQMQQLVSDNQITSVEELIPLLDKELQANFSIIVKSRSTQEGTFEQPRVNLFSTDAKFLLSFNGGQEQKGGNSIEMIEFNSKEKLFEFSRIQFVDGKPEFLTPMEAPSRCFGCHASSKDSNEAKLEAHPIWESYPDWPDRFGASHFPLNNRGASRAESSTWMEQNFQSFKSMAQNHPRYKYLVGLEGTSLEHLGEVNTKYGDQILSRSFEKLANQVTKHPLFKRFESAWLISQGSTERLVDGQWKLDKDSESKFLDALNESDRKDYLEKIDLLRDQIFEKLKLYYSKKTERYRALTKTSPVHIPFFSSQTAPSGGAIADFDSGHISDLSRMAFLLEKMGFPQDIINLTLEKNSYSIVQGSESMLNLKDAMEKSMQRNSCTLAF